MYQFVALAILVISISFHIPHTDQQQQPVQKRGNFNVDKPVKRPAPPTNPPRSDFNGVSVEVPQSTTRDVDFFNRDNHIYIPGREFIFSYTFMKHHNRYCCGTSQAGDTITNRWTLVKPSESDPLVIKCLAIRVLSGYGGLDQLFPDYSQTVIQQRYLNSDPTPFAGRAHGTGRKPHHRLATPISRETIFSHGTESVSFRQVSAQGRAEMAMEARRY